MRNTDGRLEVPSHYTYERRNRSDTFQLDLNEMCRRGNNHDGAQAHSFSGFFAVLMYVSMGGMMFGMPLIIQQYMVGFLLTKGCGYGKIIGGKGIQ